MYPIKRRPPEARYTMSMSGRRQPRGQSVAGTTGQLSGRSRDSDWPLQRLTAMELDILKKMFFSA